MTLFHGSSTFGETINPGEYTYLPNGNVLARGIVERYNDFNSDPRVTGVETIVSNANFKPAPSSEIGLAGHLWGTYSAAGFSSHKVGDILVGLAWSKASKLSSGRFQ